MNGMVYLVGAGPGDYRLITLKGKECLEKADVVICDYLADKRLMAFAKDDIEYICENIYEFYYALTGKEKTILKGII